MDAFRFEEDFGRAAPDDDKPVELIFLFEIANVLTELLGEIEFRFAFFDVRTVEILHEGTVERRGHGLDRFKELCGFVEMLRVKNAGLSGGFVGVIREGVPAAEDDVIQVGELDEFFDFRDASFGAAAEANGAHLGERSHGHGCAPTDEFDSGHQCSADGAHAGRQYTEFSFWRSNADGPAHSDDSPFLRRFKTKEDDVALADDLQDAISVDIVEQCFTMASMRIAKTVCITLPPDLLKKAQKLAAKEHRTMSELFREALRHYLNEAARGEASAERRPGEELAPVESGSSVIHSFRMERK